jgi:hypothetical protein
MILLNDLKDKDWRFERKFVINKFSKSELETLIKLHPAIFSEIFYERQVNNIYFDTDDYSNYWDNVIGSSNRQKIRIRWYGELFGNIEKPVLELKIKKGNVGTKISCKLESFSVDESLSINKIRDIFKYSPVIPERFKIYLVNLNFSLMNSYYRKYFQSADKLFRITLDDKLEYINIMQRNNLFLSQYDEYNNIILELKYGNNDDQYASVITRQFPFRTTKSSKYVNGIEIASA